MPFFAALSTDSDTRKALDEVCMGALAALEGRADLALIFFSPHHADGMERMAGDLQKRLGVSCLLGCSGESIVGNEREIERRPALSLWLARWAKPMNMDPFHLAYEQTPDGDKVLGLPASIAAADPRQSAILLLADPFSFRVNDFLQLTNERFKELRVMGALASGGNGAGQGKLLLGDTIVDRGAVGVLLSGSVPIRCIVSQGCRPIGGHFVISKARENIILELDGTPPSAQLQQLWQMLSPREQQASHRGLLIGRVVKKYGDKSEADEYLVRNTLGLDRDSGGLTVNEPVSVGQKVQFHIRDAECAGEDFHRLLQRQLRGQEQKPSGALLFTCNLRGSRLFSQAHHDAGALRAEAGNIPVAGFFALGEIGPVGGQNFIHGNTATVVLFED